MGNSFASNSPTSLVIQGENESKNKSTIRAIEENIQLINARDNDGNTMLHRACKGGNKKLVDKLISKGAEIDASNHKGMTPFHIACWEGHEHIVTSLLANSANINATDSNGCTGLHFACEGGHIPVAILLLSAEEPARINRDAIDLAGWSALHEACRHGHYELARALIVVGADVSLQNHDGNRALDYVSDDRAREILSNAAEYVRLSAQLSKHSALLPISLKQKADSDFPERTISWESMKKHPTLQMASMV